MDKAWESLVRKNAQGRVITCPYCDRRAKLEDSSKVYGRSYGLIWLCESCRAWVGVHKKSDSAKPLGTLADAELRDARRKAHAAFDPLWRCDASLRKRKGPRHQRLSQARHAAYRWLAEQMGLSKKECHIGMFDLCDCANVLRICESVQSRARHGTDDTSKVD